MFHTLLGPSGSLLVSYQGLTALVCHSFFFFFFFLSRMGILIKYLYTMLHDFC